MYGVDQCRVCGVAITPTGPKAREAQELANRKPHIPEAEWRRRGYLTSPTRVQLAAGPSDGCCWPCGIKEMHKLYRYKRRRIGVLIVMVGLAAFVMYIVTFLPH